MSNPDSKVERRCPLCQGESFVSTPYGNSEWPIVTCLTCSFVYMRIVPDYSRLTEELAWERTSKVKTDSRRNNLTIKNRLRLKSRELRKRLFPRDKLGRLVKAYVAAGNILDVGCAAGSFLSRLPKSYKPYGIEISNALALQAVVNLRPRNGVIVNDSALNGLARLPADFFEGIVMSAFLEHDPAPVEVLQRARNTLRDGGRLIIKVPNYGSLLRLVRSKRWCGFRLPEHVNYFTPQSLAACGQLSGLKVKKFTLADRWPLSDNMWMVLEK